MYSIRNQNHKYVFPECIIKLSLFLIVWKNGNYMNLFNAEISEIILDCELGNFLPRIWTLRRVEDAFRIETWWPEAQIGSGMNLAEWLADSLAVKSILLKRGLKF